MSRADEVYAFVRQIPKGKVLSYGQVAEACGIPSARQVGRWMAFAPDDVPWWRVVGADGTLRIQRRDPMLASLQRAHLESEGVPFNAEGRVIMAQCQWEEPQGQV
ncbi:MAG: MGMT family protein [Fimbriimonadales bacterium]